MTDKEKEVVKKLNNPLYTVEFLEEWLQRYDDVFSNPVAALAMGARGFYDAVHSVVENKLM